MLAAWLASIGRINGVVNRDDYGTVRGRRAQFPLEPVNLCLAELSAFRTVAVQANDRNQRSEQRPVNIGLCHRGARRILPLRSVCRYLGAEIAHKSVQAALAGLRVDVAVVVAG